MTPTQGMINGGWEYVWAVYGITWTVLLAFLAFAFLRARSTP